MLKRMRRIRRVHPVRPPRSAVTGFRFPREVIVLAVRWYLRYGLSYRDVEELLAERGVQVDHVSIYRWVRRFTPILAEAARCAQHAIGSRWQVDETYVKVAGCWRYVYRAVDEYGQVDRCVPLPSTGQRRSQTVLSPCSVHRYRGAGRSDYRPGRLLSAGARRGSSQGVPSHRALRQQQDRSRPRPVETTAATDARPEDRRQRQDCHRRACLHSKHSPWPLFTVATTDSLPMRH